MINNPGIQTNAAIAWDGTTSFPRRIQNYIDFGFVFETTVDLAAPAIFVVQFHDDDDVDPCTPGDGVDALENVVCRDDIADGALATFSIPTGTKAGTFCSGTVPCKEGKWVSLRHVSGGANVRAVTLMQGPKRVY